MVVFLLKILLFCVFGLAGLAKLADRAGSVRSLTEFGVPQALIGPVATALPLIELVCAALLLPTSSARFGAAGVAAMLIVFTGASAVALARGRAPACRCFGQLSAERIGPRIFVRNTVLLLAALVVVFPQLPAQLVPAQSSASIADAWQALETLPGLGALIGLSLAGNLALGFLGFHLLRQHGRLLLRLERVESQLGGAAETLQSGLAVGTDAPSFSLASLDDGHVALEQLVQSNRPLILTFVEPGCAACEALLPDVALWQQSSGRLTVAVVSTGEDGPNREKTGAHGVRTVLLQRDREVAEAYGVTGTPSAVLIRDGAVASALAMGAEAIRTLVAEALTVGVSRGDVVPPLELPDLAGRPFDLGRLGGASTLLLFWNPGCGYCQRMLADLKAWESRADEAFPPLVVISTGSVEANRAMALSSRVLIDDGFRAGRTFGASGTPSAVLIEGGRAASEVAVGADAIRALAARPQTIAGALVTLPSALVTSNAGPMKAALS